MGCRDKGSVAAKNWNLTSFIRQKQHKITSKILIRISVPPHNNPLVQGGSVDRLEVSILFGR